jgi:hypothetical protein
VNERRKLDEILRYERETHRDVEEIERRLHFNRFTIYIQEIPMAIGSLTSPGTATLLLSLLDNGQPYTAVEGYVFTPTLTSNDTSIQIVADATTPNEFDLTIPSGDTSQSATFNATATAPDGSTAIGALTIPFMAVAQQFTIKIAQTA